MNKNFLKVFFIGLAIIYFVVASLPLFKNMLNKNKQTKKFKRQEEWIEEPMLIEKVI
jgi:uncharacterized membrane protein YciS (DUF1049 family)